MADWHDSSCRRLDLATAFGITSCQGCGSVQPNEASTVSNDQSDTAMDAIYQPLEARTHMRLLTLEPGEFDEPIRCSLSLKNTSSWTDYEAISYTWAGEDNVMERTGRIWLSSREFRVTPNCEAALRRVRRRWSSRVIWIDAVCINQEDDNERGHQVRLMQQIYSQARGVLVYIGEPTSQEEPLLEELTADDNRRKENEMSDQVDHKSRLPTLRLLFGRKYFSRAWILQEVILARKATVMCGRYTLPWSSLHMQQLRARYRMETDLKLPPVLRLRASTYRDSGHLLKLLDLARHSHATDPRDKVFAVFGLISCAESDGLSADYTKPMAEVFMKIAEWIAQRFGLLAMVVRCANVMDCIDEQSVSSNNPWGPNWTPSWAPNWAEKPLPNAPGDLCQLIDKTSSPFLGCSLPVRVSMDTCAIEVPAFKFGTLPDGVSMSQTSRRVLEPYEREPANHGFPPTAFTAIGNNRNKTWKYGESLIRIRNPDDIQVDRWAEDEIYLIPEPGNFTEFSFEEPGEVNVHYQKGELSWSHKNTSGKLTQGQFSEVAFCCASVADGSVHLRRLLKMYPGPRLLVEKRGQFEYIRILSDVEPPGSLGSDPQESFPSPSSA